MSDWQRAKEWLNSYEFEDDKDAVECIGIIEEALDQIEQLDGLINAQKALYLPCIIGDDIYVINRDGSFSTETVVGFETSPKGWVVKTNIWHYLFAEFGSVFFTNEVDRGRAYEKIATQRNKVKG